MIFLGRKGQTSRGVRLPSNEHPHGMKVAAAGGVFWQRSRPVGRGQAETRYGRTGQSFRIRRNIEHQSIGWFFEIAELAGENGLAGEVAVSGENVPAHLVVGSAQIDDAHVEAG